MKQDTTVNIKNAAPQKDDDQKRERSTIQFPYGDLDSAVEVVKAVYNLSGLSCSIDQLAASLNQAAKGGAFQLRLTYPRIFGLADVSAGQITLTELGQRMADPTQEEQARVDAFLNVPLYKAVYEKYKGYTLPPTAALEREMQNLGVSSKQTDKARQAFDRSAKQAGFFNLGSDRLVIPPLKNRPPESKPLDNNGSMGNKRKERQPESDEYHPFIQGLLKTLPEAETVWPVEDREKWLSTAKSVFSLMYKEE